VSTTQRFEGPTIEAVLAQIEQEMGAEATIVNAHKVRRGGLGGFFSRERCEVEVLLPAPTPGAVPEAATPSAGPIDILALVEEVSDAELAVNGNTAPAPEPAAPPEPDVPARPARSFAAILADLTPPTPTEPRSGHGSLP
jgi:hypothetical protein